MKSEKRILAAFLLNLGFSLIEFLGGTITGSVAIASDAVHDLGDALSIGVSWFLERKSKGEPDAAHSYGYGRYSVLGSGITTCILILGSLAVIYNGILRIIHPTELHQNRMILFALFGAAVNFFAAYFTRGGESLNQRAVNLHMLEDVLGWAVVLVGAVLIKITDLTIIDPILSLGVAGFILVNALKNMKEVLDVFLEKTPWGVEVEEIKGHLLAIQGIKDVHHIHIWSMDGHHHYGTMHVVTDRIGLEIREAIRGELKAHGVGHVTLELEEEGELCHEIYCHTEAAAHGHHHHHHHH